MRKQTVKQTQTRVTQTATQTVTQKTSSPPAQKMSVQADTPATHVEQEDS